MTRFTWVITVVSCWGIAILYAIRNEWIIANMWLITSMITNTLYSLLRRD